MISIGINYLTELDNMENKYNDLYKFLIRNKYINTIKFPGKYCNYVDLEMFVSFAKKTNVKIDLHGIPGMIPAIHSSQFIKNVDWELLKKILKNQDIIRFSTHMGLENKDRLENYTTKQLQEVLDTNISDLKKNIQESVNNEIQVGIENIPGGFDFDTKTIKPDFISKNWKNADFGVFDISHAKLAANELKISYDEYLSKIKYKEKVKIIHISGNIDETNKYSNKPDKHVLINKNEIKDIIKTLQQFNSIDLIVSEYAFNTKYSYEKELVIETITLFAIIKTMNYNIAKDILEFLEENLNNDISNIEEILKLVKIKIAKTM